VVVVGGGPAGSMAAASLAGAGYDVVLLDREKHPRNTVGESLIPDFWKYCDAIGVSGKIEAEGFVRKAGGIVDWRGETRRLAFRDFGYARPALHVERDRFDAILLEHARERGARVHEGVLVTAVELGVAPGARVACRADGDSAPWRVACRFVVDASGQSALLGRQLGLRVMDEEFRFMSVWGYFTGSKYVAADQTVHAADSYREIPPTTYTTSIPGAGDWGWSWHIQLRESASVGLVVPLESVKELKARGGDLERYLTEQCLALPRLAQLLGEARLLEGSVRAIRDFSYYSRQLAGPGFFLVGDAAGFVDPVFSIGVVLGLYSAHAAAWAIDRSLRRPESVDRYRALYASQVRGRMELARALALPQYRAGAAATPEAKAAMRFAGGDARELIRAASRLTDRSEHFYALDGDAADDLPARSR
jgi:flavin-dependent dehydrogenase